MKTSPEKVMGHTEGKLTADDVTISDSEGEPIAHLEWSGHHEADARRLVTCWNALSSVPTEWLESFGDGIIEQIQENVALKQERDELVNALRKTSIMGAAYYGMENPHKLHQVFVNAEAILARYPENKE